MNNKQQEERISFCHRPDLGFSIGAKSEAGQIYIALALANDGWSLNGRYNKSRRDSFSRKKSRMIITGRLDTLLKGNAIKLTESYHSKLRGYEFIKNFRIILEKELESYGLPTRDGSVSDMIFDINKIAKRAASTTAPTVYRNEQKTQPISF